MEKKWLTAVYTDPIEIPPVPGYRKVDTDQTIRDNKAKVGLTDKVEQEVKGFIEA
jgi:hypothetical protein